MSYQLNLMDPKPGSSLTVINVQLKTATLKVRRGYFYGSIPWTDWDNAKYQSVIVSVEFRDGSSTSATICKDLTVNKNWPDQVIRALKVYEAQEDAIDFHLKQREHLDALIGPLQKERGKHAQRMFTLAEKMDHRAASKPSGGD